MIHYKFKNIKIVERSKRTYIDLHMGILVFSYFSVSESDIRITRFVRTATNSIYPIVKKFNI